MPNRRQFLRDGSAGLGLAAAAGREVRVRLLDAVTGRPIAARVRFLDAHKQEVTPAGHAPSLAADDVEGDARFDLRRFCYVNGEWRGGDIHIHNISPKTCRLEMQAEDLDVANILTSDFTTGQQEFEGRINANSTMDSLIYVGQEFRHDHPYSGCFFFPAFLPPAAGGSAPQSVRRGPVHCSA